MIKMELLAVKDVDTGSVSIMNDEQKLAKAEETKERANEAYRAQRYDEALLLFKEASSYVARLSQYTEQTQEVRKLILQNVALT